MPPLHSDAPICLDAPSMFGCPLYVRCHHMFGYPPYVWVPHCMFGHCQMYGGIQRYEGHPNWGCPNIQWHLNIWGHPNVWGQMDTPQSEKACFLCIVYVQQASKHLPNIWGIQTYGSVHTYSGGIQT